MNSLLYIENIGKDIVKVIVNELDRVGLLYRIFYRVKSEQSILSKIKDKGYSREGNQLTDILGIRIILYFKDDVNLVYKYLKSNPCFDHEAIETPSPQIFKPERLNLTFKFEEKYLHEIHSSFGEYSDLIKGTYEIQIRTVLSEGWHEVEHDHRYKTQSDWVGHEDLLRNLNGLFATLDTSDFTMLKVFDTLSYRHYKNCNYNALLRSKFRLRTKSKEISSELKSTFERNPLIVKDIFNTNRELFLEKFIKSRVAVPLTLDNVVFIINEMFFKHSVIENLIDDFIKEEIQIGLSRNN